MTQSYLFYGLEGTGRKRAATNLLNRIAQTVLTEEEIFSGKLEDIFLLEPTCEEKKGKKIVRDISVDQARAAINFLNFLPSKLKRRFLVVMQAERMNAAAANSLLKIIEEPPKKATVIFLAENLEKILPTLLSRLEKKPLSFLTETEIIDYLRKKKASLALDSLEKIARMSGGRLILAEKYLTDEILMLSQEKQLNEFRLAVKGGLGEGFALAEALATDKLVARKAIDNWVFYLRNFLMENIRKGALDGAASQKMMGLIKGLLTVKEKLDRPSANARLIWENFFLSVS